MATGASTEKSKQILKETRNPCCGFGIIIPVISALLIFQLMPGGVLSRLADFRIRPCLGGGGQGIIARSPLNSGAGRSPRVVP